MLARALSTLLYLAGGWVALADTRTRLAGALLAIPAIIGLWTGYVLPEEHSRTAAALLHGSAAVFQTFVLCVLMRGINREPTISWDAVAAAMCGYLLLGVAFAQLYCLVNDAVPGSFTGLNVSDEVEVHVVFTYFSFVTLTTVGYGDITPTVPAARSLALAEAVIGQFYLTVLVADLVGKRVSQALAKDLPK